VGSGAPGSGDGMTPSAGEDHPRSSRGGALRRNARGLTFNVRRDMMRTTVLADLKVAIDKMKQSSIISAEPLVCFPLTCLLRQSRQDLGNGPAVRLILEAE